jgi:hypothetical protein
LSLRLTADALAFLLTILDCDVMALSDYSLTSIRNKHVLFDKNELLTMMSAKHRKYENSCTTCTCGSTEALWCHLDDEKVYLKKKAAGGFEPFEARLSLPP